MGHADSQQADPAGQALQLRVADLDVDLATRSVRRGTELLEVSDRSFRLLEALIRHATEPVSKDQLIAQVWDDAVVSDETLAQRVRLLRQSLGDDSQNPRYIASVRGRGYRLVAAVDEIQAKQHKRGRRSPWLLVAVALLLGLVFVWRTTDDPEPGAPVREVDVLAVLPFTDLGPGGDHQFFADGMHEELLSQLAMIDDLAVISRTSVERYRGTGESLPDIAAQLGANAVIEGSIRVVDDRLRITVQLIDGSSDAHIWASQYDRRLSMQDIFALQTEVAGEIAAALRLEYADAGSAAARLPTDDIEAYNLYLLGRYHTFRQTRHDLENAVDFLERAIAIDPQFAEAYATLGWAYSFLGSEYGTQLPAAMYPKAKEAALRAIALDPEMADARSLYADILTWYDWDFAAAEREYRTTVELDPLNVLGYALFLSTQHRHDEAIALIEKRIAAHPKDPYVHVNAGWRYLHAGLPDKAIEAAMAARGHRDSDSLLGWSRLAQDNTAAAIDVFAASLRAHGRTPQNLANLAMAYFRAGRPGDAEPLLEELRELAADNYVSPALLAAVNFSAGRADKGFELLEKAFEQRSREMIFLEVNQFMRGYRDDPRYMSLAERVGLHQSWADELD